MHCIEQAFATWFLYHAVLVWCRWYDENADRIWGPEPNRPTLAAARIHAKCLRSVDAVR